MASLSNERFEVAIIGAGMAGLAAGIRLAIAGKNVIILERHNASGGLNSFYSIDGRKYDVGLHALTNYVPKGTKGAPLTKLLRQLRIPYDALDLSPQIQSRIAFPNCELIFTNDFQYFESQVAERFPQQIDGFKKLVHCIREFDAFALDSRKVSARKRVQSFITDPLLEDMIFCPVMYYGSATEHDMDFGQFTIMFQSLFFEGFARPFAGVRVLIKLLQDKYRSLGGIRKMKCGVQAIIHNGKHASGLLLDSGESIYADKIISTAGLVETHQLFEESHPNNVQQHTGQLGFTETITALNKSPQDFGWNDTIVFFNSRERFHYARVEDSLVDPTSGVLCFPNNYQYSEGRTLNEGLLRVTAMASYQQWCALDDANYQAQKDYWYATLQKVALTLLPKPEAGFSLQAHTLAKDIFTPRTVRKFTGHLNGAIYGANHKVKDGRTPLNNVFLAGTDQGFLGIVGALMSGISMANLHGLSSTHST
jgi:phytoene dehydrogenase-like protein